MSADPSEVCGMDISEKITEYTTSYNTLNKIAEYCRASQASSEFQKVYQQTQNYSNDVLSNTAYHVHTIGTYLTHYITSQSHAIDRLELSLRTLNERIAIIKTIVGMSALRSQNAQVMLNNAPRLVDLDPLDYPPSAQVAMIAPSFNFEECISKNPPFFIPHDVPLVPLPMGAFSKDTLDITSRGRNASRFSPKAEDRNETKSKNKSLSSSSLTVSESSLFRLSSSTPRGLSTSRKS